MSGWGSWLAAGASIATLVALVVALIVFILEERARAKEDAQDRADSIRRDLSTFVESFRRVREVWAPKDAHHSEGSVIVAGSVAVASKYRDVIDWASWVGPSRRRARMRRCGRLRTRRGADITFRDLVRNDGDGSLANLVAVSGWWSSALSLRLDEELIRLATSAQALPGELVIMFPISRLLRRIADDSHSPKIFTRMLHGEIGTRVAADVDENGEAAFTRTLAKSLSSNAAAYYSTRYKTATDDLLSMSELIVKRLTELNDTRLLELARRHAEDASEEPTLIGEIRSRLLSLREDLGPGYESATSLLTRIEEGISKTT
jgi:hypothetical protein